ncbi:unnamed protein product [Lactuca saligna]|uniref:Ubiquitin-like protease family profile domain-containing protein n=1 Tax=Lactuca saligna TaxID=75948 RepID=A0AA35Z4K4_LACSI|nr:unnamed protein product [Lactuca saligna]
MKNRCSPEALLSIILGMSKEQKEFVRSMGFGAFLKMKITDIPLKLGFYVLQKFDSERMVIDIEGKELKVTTEFIHDMLGIPIGGTKLTQLDQWPKDDTSYDEWKQQFKKDSIIRLNAIKNVMVSTTQADFNFKLNFLVLFVNTFCESTSMGRCNLFPLSYISRKTDISNIDWCSYVLDCLVRTKNSYIPYLDNSFFVGPSVFLVLFYADNIHSEALTVTRKRPTICYWSSEKIRYRETLEQEKGRFAVGELNEKFVNEQNEGDTDLEDSDPDKDEDHSVEAYESKISKMINSFERMKEKLNSKLNDAMTKFPEKESFRIFKEKMNNMIVEEKTESTTLFNFPINEIGVEGINLTPIMGQKTNDQTENEDKEGNGEEDSDNGASQPEVDYLFDSNESNNKGIKNDADKNKKEGEIRVKEKDAKRNENQNDEEEKDDHAEETNNHEETIQKTKNQNLLDKVVDNIVDNVVGIGVLILNSQEDEIWNHPEMKTIFDNIDIGSPLSTGKTNTLAEKENQKVYMNKEQKLKKQREMIQARKTLKIEMKEEWKLRTRKMDVKKNKQKLKKEMQKIEERKSQKIKTRKEKKLTRQKEINERCGCPEKIWSNSRKSSYGSLYANTEIFGEVLDTWSDLLNHQELERGFGNSPYRLFLKVGVSTAYLTSTLSDERKYEKFKENFHDSTNGYKKILNIKDIDMVFFPVVKSAHIFVIVFNLKKPPIEILDNSAVEGDYEGKYGVIMKHLVFKNNVDCGVFAMRHMETYMGQPLLKWKPGLHKESAVQQTTLEKLKQRYAHIMLTSEINMLKAKVLDLAEKYQKVEFKVRTDHAYKAMQTIQKKVKRILMIACEDERMLKCDAIEQFVLKMNGSEVHIR